MSCSKLLTRIVAPDIPSIEDDAYTDDEDSDMSSSGGDSDNDRFRVRGGAMKLIHDHTFGITSDPLTQFTVILSALIHDVGA